MRQSRPTGAVASRPRSSTTTCFDTPSVETIATCGWLMIGNEIHVPDAAGIGDGERPAGQVVGDEPAGAGACRDVGDGAGERAEAEPVGVADDRHHETLEVEVDRDAEVDGAVHDERIAVDARVDERERAQRVDHSARDEREVREREAFLRPPRRPDVRGAPLRSPSSRRATTHNVCADVCFDATSSFAARLRTLLNGAISSPSGPLGAAPSTSSRVTRPFAPVPCTCGDVDPEVGRGPARRARNERFDRPRRPLPPGQYFGISGVSDTWTEGRPYPRPRIRRHAVRRIG